MVMRTPFLLAMMDVCFRVSGQPAKVYTQIPIFAYCPVALQQFLLSANQGKIRAEFG